MTETPTLDIQPERDPLATIAASVAPVVLEGRYRPLIRALWQLRHSRRTRWGLGLGSAAVMLALAILAVRHFATTSWPQLTNRYMAVLFRQRISRRLAEGTSLGMALEALTAANLAYPQPT